MMTPVRRLEATFASLLVVAVAATGCGSSSSKGATAVGTSAAATTSAAAATTSAAAAATSGAAVTSAPAAATSGAATSGPAASTPAVVPPPSAAAITSVKATGGGDFCKSLAAFINNSRSFGTTPAEVKVSLQKAQAETVVLLSEAPSAIKTDLTTLFTAETVLYNALVKANYDYTKVPQSALDAISTPATTAAETRADAYVKTSCGIDVGASS